MTGRMARFADDNWPTTSSRLISRPTTKKNTTISRSLIQSCTESANAAAPQVTPTFV